MDGPNDETALRERLEDAFWRRHANPLSSGTRILAVPLLTWAIYRRDRRLLVATAAFVAVNPFSSRRPREPTPT